MGDLRDRQGGLAMSGFSVGYSGAPSRTWLDLGSRTPDSTTYTTARLFGVSEESKEEAPTSTELIPLLGALQYACPKSTSAPMSNTTQPPQDHKPKLRIRSVGGGKCWLEIDAIVPLETALDVMKAIRGADEQNAEEGTHGIKGPRH